MSVWALLVLTAMLLMLPWISEKGTTPLQRAPAKREIRGLLRLLAVLNTLYCSVWHQLANCGYAPLPEHGAAILISNHTCGIDHLLLQSRSRRLLGFMVAREYYEWKWIHWICRYIGCIPVNRDGRDFAATRAGLRALKNGRVLPIFPEGHIVPASGTKLDDMMPGTAYLAIRAQVPVIPAYIHGTPWTNEIIESIVTPSRARVIFGELIDLSDIHRDRAGDKQVQAEVSERFKQAFLALQARAFSYEE
jgi:1-acyl-sn-glycerol-3-phosphate acyltransferase